MNVSTAIALRAQGLTVHYGARPALCDFTLLATAGELLALAGPNGSGKTTFLRAVLGLVPPTMGRIDIFGRDAARLTFRDRARRVAWLPQEESPQDNVSLLDYVLFGRYAHVPPFTGEDSEDYRRARNAIIEVGLWDRRDSGILELSGGERQRVLLARAIAQDTPILLLDEPTAHLDIGHQLELLDRIRRLCHDQQRTVVAAMHDLNLAARFADRVAVLSRGRLVEEGRPSDVLSEGLLREVWGIQAELRWDPRTQLPFLIPVLAPLSERGLRHHSIRPGPVHVVGGGGAAAPILRRLVEEGFRVTAGVLPLFDTDSETAAELGVPVATEVPFAPIGEEARGQNRKLLDGAAAIVVAPFAVGPANLTNLEDLIPYVVTRPTFLLAPTPWRERDFVKGRASGIASELQSRGARPLTEISILVDELHRALGRAAPLPPADGVRPEPATADG